MAAAAAAGGGSSAAGGAAASGGSAGLLSLGGTLIGVGGSLIGARWNRKWQQKQNEIDRQHAIDMYNQQRADEIEFWNMQNAYNHPTQQMQRLREAGLNPHLVYGKGADNTASSLSSPKYNEQNQNAPMLDPGLLNRAFSQLGGAFMSYVDLKQKQAQTDNLHEQLNLLKRQTLLTEAKTANTLSDTAMTDYQRQQATELHDSIIRKAQLENDISEKSLKAMDLKMTLDLNRDERERLSNAVNVRATMQSILESKERVTTNEIQREHIKQQIDQLKALENNTKLESQMKVLDINLKKIGLQPTDPLYQRIFFKTAAKLAEKEGVGKGIQDKSKYFEEQ